MMYNSKLVCSLKSSKGQILREFKDTVFIPFGEEFSIYLKNLNSLRTSVNIEIDGEDVLNGSSLIINGNQDLNLERYLSNLNSGNRFKFIERTQNIENHRGVKSEDGLIRIEFEFEKESFQWKYDNYRISEPYSKSIIRGRLGSEYETRCATSFSAQASSQQNDVGITVPGSVSNQQFQTVSGFIGDGTKHVIVLRLLGEQGQNQVIAPVTVKAKPKCITCGKLNKATAKFCQECGTALQIIS